MRSASRRGWGDVVLSAEAEVMRRPAPWPPPRQRSLRGGGGGSKIPGQVDGGELVSPRRRRWFDAAGQGDLLLIGLSAEADVVRQTWQRGWPSTSSIRAGGGGSTSGQSRPLTRDFVFSTSNWLNLLRPYQYGWSGRCPGCVPTAFPVEAYVP